jgi:hypothetical protein
MPGLKQAADQDDIARAGAAVGVTRSGRYVDDPQRWSPGLICVQASYLKYFKARRRAHSLREGDSDRRVL